jgi:hypothetical protein
LTTAPSWISKQILARNHGSSFSIREIRPVPGSISSGPMVLAT